ncbi:hypothetical protein F0562_009242 [Nyssa sinensis]|uniref:Uncharacterized protein n=1 Tax=Nyssa sinensis TaxID=561372 RepID=A0A5J4ZXM0_9ASTE|nr:hypothetical protein F0562_009242 [Nyssa sinensis]
MDLEISHDRDRIWRNAVSIFARNCELILKIHFLVKGRRGKGLFVFGHMGGHLLVTSFEPSESLCSLAIDQSQED